MDFNLKIKAEKKNLIKKKLNLVKLFKKKKKIIVFIMKSNKDHLLQL